MAEDLSIDQAKKFLNDNIIPPANYNEIDFSRIVKQIGFGTIITPFLLLLQSGMNNILNSTGVLSPRIPVVYIDTGYDFSFLGPIPGVFHLISEEFLLRDIIQNDLLDKGASVLIAKKWPQQKDFLKSSAGKAMRIFATSLFASALYAHNAHQRYSSIPVADNLFRNIVLGVLRETLGTIVPSITTRILQGG